MSNITDGVRDIFLAGVGAVALGAEKSKELIDQLVAKGEITVEQGKQLNTELKHQAVSFTTSVREDSIAAQMSAMTPEERDAFAAKVAAMAAEANAKDAQAAVGASEPSAAAADAPAEAKAESEAAATPAASASDDAASPQA